MLHAALRVAAFKIDTKWTNILLSLWSWVAVGSGQGLLLLKVFKVLLSIVWSLSINLASTKWSQACLRCRLLAFT